VQWHEYELTVHPLPGHTRFAAAVEVEVDGRRVLATGDQQADTATRPILNYQYRNRFEPDDFMRSAELYRRLRPDLIVSGHWLPQEVDDAYLDALHEAARRLAALHRDLLPEEGLGTDGFAARIEPYTSTVAAGSEIELDVIVRNPSHRDQPAVVRLETPDAWRVAPEVQEVALEAGGEAVATFRVTAPASGVVAADITIGDTRFGQQAEALVEVR
jgi:hypothetical protein